MKRIDGAGHINNRFVAEDVQAGRPPTELTAEWHNDVQEEICAVIESTGGEANGESQHQLKDAINILLSDALNRLKTVTEFYTKYDPNAQMSSYSRTIYSTGEIIQRGSFYTNSNGMVTVPLPHPVSGIYSLNITGIEADLQQTSSWTIKCLGNPQQTSFGVVGSIAAQLGFYWTLYGII